MAEFPEVIYSHAADSPGYTRYLLAEPVGQAAAGVVVRATIKGQEDPFYIVLHGQREFDVPGEVELFEIVDALG